MMRVAGRYEHVIDSIFWQPISVLKAESRLLLMLIGKFLISKGMLFSRGIVKGES